MSSKTELKPCPLCGGEAYSGTKGNGWGESIVRCTKCGLEVEGTAPCAGAFHTEPAEEKWNRRVPV